MVRPSARAARRCVGRFVAPPEPVPSRWRPGAMVYALDLRRGRRGCRASAALLSGELVPLGADAVLGLKREPAGAGRGDHFFFVLERG
ncbi:MAG: hypothetical protein U1F43_36380 [Myxococcota bacterium]